MALFSLLRLLRATALDLLAFALLAGVFSDTARTSSELNPSLLCGRKSLCRWGKGQQTHCTNTRNAAEDRLIISSGDGGSGIQVSGGLR